MSDVDSDLAALITERDAATVASVSIPPTLNAANANAASVAPTTITITTTPPGPRRYGIDVAEFLSVVDEDADPYVVAGLVPEGMPTMIVGAPKSRKSWLMIHLAVCIAAGLPAFGRATRRGKVLVIAREDTAKETRRRIRLVMRALGVTAEHVTGWLRVDSSQILYFDQLEHVEMLAETLHEFRPSVAFVDSLSRVHNQDENSRSDMAKVMNVWSDLCTRFACSVVLLHHVVKWADEGTLIQRIRGSGDIGAVLRAAIGVSKSSEDTSTIETDGNLADLAPPFDIRFADQDERGAPLAATDPDRARKRARVAITLADPESGAQHGDPISDPIVGELADRLLTGGTVTVTKLRRGYGRKCADEAIALLSARGLVVAVYQGKKHCGYKLTEAGCAFAACRPAKVTTMPDVAHSTPSPALLAIAAAFPDRG